MVNLYYVIALLEVTQPLTTNFRELSAKHYLMILETSLNTLLEYILYIIRLTISDV